MTRKEIKKSVPLSEVYRVIAGHSNYHGDDILATLTCIAEGKKTNVVKPFCVTHKIGKWITPPYTSGYHCSLCKFRNNFKGKFCPNCGAEMESEDNKHD